MDPDVISHDPDASPTVSVIVPTYNAARWLTEAVDSALAQSLADIEVLVFDNASTDATPELMARIDDPRFRYHRYAENVGFAGNVTRGIAAARGRYLVVLGADDILEPGFLAAAVARLDAAPEAAMLHGRAVWIDDDGARRGVMAGHWPERCSGGEAFLRCFTEGFCFSTLVARTGLVRRFGAMDEDWGMISDSWLFLKLCLEGDILFLDAPMVRYRVRESSLSFELYADGKMFRDHMAGLEAAYGWPEAAHLAADRRRARVAVAETALQTLHLTRLGSGLRGARRQISRIVRAEPRVLLRHEAWMRIGFAMLPAPLIARVRARRRSTGQPRHARQ